MVQLDHVHLVVRVDLDVLIHLVSLVLLAIQEVHAVLDLLEYLVILVAQFHLVHHANLNDQEAPFLLEDHVLLVLLDVPFVHEVRQDQVYQQVLWLLMETRYMH